MNRRSLSSLQATLLGLCLYAPVSAAGPVRSASVTVTPRSALLDAPFRIDAKGLRAHERVTVRTIEHSARGRLWSARREVRADVRRRLALSGAGLLSSMQPVGLDPAGDVFPKPYASLRVHLLAGARILATARAIRFVSLPSVRVEDERPAQTGFYGKYFDPGGSTQSTSIMLIGGSEGGLPNRYAASLLASHGYPVLALAYFAAPGLPHELNGIPLEYFREALAWLRKPVADRVAS